MSERASTPSWGLSVYTLFLAVWFPLSSAAFLRLWWDGIPSAQGTVGVALAGLFVGMRWGMEEGKALWRLRLLGVALWALWLPCCVALEWGGSLGARIGFGCFVAAWGWLWGGSLRWLLEGWKAIWEGRFDLSEAPWSLALFFTLFAAILLPFLFLPYIGRLSLHLFVAFGMGLVLIEGAQELRETRAFYRWGWLLGGGGVLFFWALPWPLPQGDHEILYTARLGGERVTLHGRRGEAGRVVSLVSQRSTFYQSVQAYRYAETMTHPAMAMASTPPKRILLVGGEDGAILQELARYTHSMRVDWLPLFADWAEFFLHAPYFRSRHRAVQQKLAIKHHELPLFFREDAWYQRLAELEKGKGQGYDLILADFPPPQHTMAMLTTQKTRDALLRLLRPEGYAVAHITSPYRERRLFWCSAGEWARSGAYLLPFQLAPSLIYDHGFLLLRRQPIPALKQPLRIPVPTRYLTPTLPFDALARFARDTSPDGRDMTEECEIPSF